MERKFVCLECHKVYFYYKNLRKHVRKAHPDKISDIAPVLKTKKTFQYKCDICGKQFNHSYNFRYHERKVHNVDNEIILNGKKFKKLKCPLCVETFPLKKKLFTHIESVHNMSIKRDNLRLQSFEEFMIWKERIEMETSSKYIKEHGSKRDLGSMKHYFVCHRSGRYIPEGTGQRKLKSQGSQKINGTCPASLLVNEIESGECNVQYISTHVGHNLEIGHLHLTPNERQHLATEIVNKIPFDTIIEEARNRAADSKLSRINLLKKKDLYNIQRKLSSIPKKICYKSSETENVESSAVEDEAHIESLIREINSNETVTVLFYKLPNTLNELHSNFNNSDFVLIIMNKWQCEVLKKYGSLFVCVDRANEFNRNGFELVTLMTMDKYRQAYPCAFLITNRFDNYVFTVFFDYIQMETGVISTSVFMSSLDECVFSAWVQVMSEPELKHYCTWHVENEWKVNKSKIKIVEKQAEALKVLNSFMYEKNSEDFEIGFQIALQQLIEDKDTAEFGRYIKDKFSNNINYWALCYRYKNVSDMNPFIERMHRTLNYLYIFGKNYKQLHTSVYSIINFIFKRLINDPVTLDDTELKSINKDTLNRHKASLKLLEDAIVEEEECGWRIQSLTSLKESYSIKRYIPSCSCKLICADCDSCIHAYVCSCSDSDLGWNMCKHIHVICNIVNSQHTNNSGNIIITGENFSIPFESEVVISENGEILVQINETECAEVTGVIELKSEDESAVNVNEKEKIKQEFLQLIDNITSENELEIVKESMSTLKALLSASHTICIANEEHVDDGVDKVDSSKRTIQKNSITPVKKIKTSSEKGALEELIESLVPVYNSS